MGLSKVLSQRPDIHVNGMKRILYGSSLFSTQNDVNWIYIKGFNKTGGFHVTN